MAYKAFRKAGQYKSPTHSYCQSLLINTKNPDRENLFTLLFENKSLSLQHRNYEILDCSGATRNAYRETIPASPVLPLIVQGFFRCLIQLYHLSHIKSLFKLLVT